MTVAATYFEDVQIGDVEVTPAMTLTEAHAALYRGLIGESPEGSATFPDLLPLCLATGLGWRVQRPPLAVLAFMSFDWKIHRELRVGDTIHGRARVTAKQDDDKPDRGQITVQRTVVNQRDEVVQEGETDLLVEKRGRP